VVKNSLKFRLNVASQHFLKVAETLTTISQNCKFWTYLVIARNTSLTDKYDNNVNLHLERQKDSIIRGHSLKLVHPRCHCDLRKYSFTVRIVNLWNSLPENVVLANTVDTFKNRLDKFWSDQELVYDYKADITRIGNRSLITLDDTSA